MREATVSHHQAGRYVAALLAGACAAAPVRTAAAQQQPDTVTATVRYVEPPQRTLSAIAGFSLALEVMRFSVATDARVTVAGSPAALGEIRLGDVVRIVYRETPAGLTADAIEVVRRGEGRP
jgi:hypothetical protein